MPFDFDTAVLDPAGLLALGTATGHTHRAGGKDVQVFYQKDNPSARLLKAPHGAMIFHDEHKPFFVPSGEYEIGAAQEIDHLDGSQRDVLD